MTSGLIQIYTGTGKGKTTAAIGAAIRGLGAGWRVAVHHFMKTTASEDQILATLPGIEVAAWGSPGFIIPATDIATYQARPDYDPQRYFTHDHLPEAYAAKSAAGYAQALADVTSGAYDLVVLDELNMALDYGLFAIPDVLALLAGKAAHTEVIITGRNAPAALLAVADLVTEMVMIKHPYEQGIPAKQGREY